MGEDERLNNMAWGSTAGPHREDRMRAGAIVISAIVLAGVVPAPDELTAEERSKLIRYLTDTREQVIAEAEALSEAQWSFKPGPARWSVGEVVQHLALAEPFLFDLQQKLVNGPPATPEQRKGAEGKDEVVLKMIPDRTQKVTAPEPLQPAGKVGARAETIEAFRDARAKTLAYVTATGDDLRGRVADSSMGPMDAYQWLLFIGAHTERHLAQLREVKADPNFPQ
jgi:hypothetical protein